MKSGSPNIFVKKNEKKNILFCGLFDQKNESIYADFGKIFKLKKIKNIIFFTDERQPQHFW